MNKYIFLILLGCIYFVNKSIAQVKSLRVVQEEQLDSVPGMVVMDSEGKIVGHEINLKKAGRFSGTYQSEINVEGWPQVTIDRYLNLIVDKKNNRLITYGHPPSNDVASAEVNLVIYTSNGELLFQKDNVLSSRKNKVAVSNSGEIYIAGWNKDFKQVIQKYEKNGKLEWETPLPFQLEVSGIDLSENDRSLVVLQNNNGWGSIELSDSKSALLHMDSTGKIIHKWTSIDNFHILKYLNNEYILISNGYHLILKEINTFDSVGEDQFTEEGIVKINSDKSSFSFLTKKNNLYQYKVVDKGLVKHKKFELSNINASSFEVNFIDLKQENMINISTKKTKFSLQ